MSDDQPDPGAISLPLERCHVLLVEVDDDSREVATILLEAHGATVTAVAHVRAGWLRAHSLDPDTSIRTRREDSRHCADELLDREGSAIRDRCWLQSAPVQISIASRPTVT